MADITNYAEVAGSILGIIGALLLATNSRVSAYGWVAFLAANVAMILFASNVEAHWLLLQQVAFTATSCLGIYRSGLFRLGRNRRSTDP